MKRSCAVAILLLLTGMTAARGDERDSLRQSLGQLPPFKLTDQNGNLVELEQLRGKVCVFSVFFSCCTSICPAAQNNMAGLQDRLAGWPDVVLVSINVYPGHDTQSIISQFARDHHADPKRWLFLHGDKKEIYDLVQNGLKQGLAENPSAELGNEVNHTPRFLVVDHRGTIRGYIDDGRNKDELDRLEKFVKQLVQAKYLPSVNAGLNASCGVLLILGFVFVRNRWIRMHKIFMLSALAVSMAFLACYIYYHFAVLDGHPTAFSGEGTIRIVYYGILFSHILLAVPVAFLALIVTYFGLFNLLSRHTVLARWTLPLWLYVSVTGVVVYWMLYHLYPPA